MAVKLLVVVVVVQDEDDEVLVIGVEVGLVSMRPPQPSSSDSVAESDPAGDPLKL